MLISTMSTNKSLPAFCSHSYQFTADHVGSSFSLLHSCLFFLFTFFLTVPCGMWDIFPTWDRTRASCIGRVKSSPLANQRSRSLLTLISIFCGRDILLWACHHLDLCSKSRSVSRSVCPTLCDPTDCSPPGSSVHGVLQARILEWVATSFSRA